MNKNYENCKKGIHKITNSRFIKGKEIKSCHCGNCETYLECPKCKMNYAVCNCAEFKSREGK